MAKQTKEKEFARWLMIQIKSYGLYPKAEATNAGAEVLNLSPVTTARYLNKITSSEGEFKLVRGPNVLAGFVATKDFPFLSLREAEQQGLTFNQLCEMQKSITYKQQGG